MKNRLETAEIVTFFSLFFIGLAVRIILWVQISPHPWWLHPLLDARVYHQAAESVAATGHLPPGSFPLSFLYPYFGGFLYRLFTPNPWVIRIAQGIIGALLPGVLFLMGKAVGGKWTGLAAGLLALGTGPLAAHETDLTPAALAVVVMTILMALFLPGVQGLAVAAGRGLATAGLVYLRPNLIFLAPFPLILTILRERQRRTAGLLFLIGAAVLVIPQVTSDYVRGRGLVFIAPHGGVNFYIGNHPEATGIWNPPWPGGTNVESLNLEIPRREATAVLNRDLTESRVSAYWVGEGIRFWFRSPWKAVKVTIRKLFLVLNSLEVPLNFPYPLIKKEISLLSWLPIGWGIVFPLAIAGWVFRPKKSFPELTYRIFLVLGLASIIPFFVADRYRLCLYPPVILLAAMGVDRFLSTKIDRRWLGSIGVGLVTAVICFAPSGVNMAGEEISFQYNQGVNLLREGKSAEAEAVFLPLTDGPLASGALTNLGVIALQRLDTQTAIVFFQEAVAIDPKNSTACYNLALALERAEGDPSPGSLNENPAEVNLPKGADP